MVTYYSQSGEDYLVRQLFPDVSDGFYVEVGALDGKRFSNTYAFDQFGWKGIIVEAHPQYIEYCRQNRPSAICVHAAVCDEDREAITFYTNSRGTLSAIEPMSEKRLEKYKDYFDGYKPVEVPAKTVTTILSENNAPKFIHVISIDVEGQEHNVVAGIDFIKYKFGVLITEYDGWLQKRRISKMLKKAGYVLAREDHGNLYFCSDPKQAEQLAKLTVDVELTHTKHPLD